MKTRQLKKCKLLHYNEVVFRLYKRIVYFAMLSMEILFFLDHTSHVINNRMLLDEEDDRKLFFNALLHELTYSHEILIEFLI